MEEVVGSFDSAVGGPARTVPGQDLVAPGNDGVDYVVELAKFAGGVEVGEPVESFEGAIVVVGLVEAVELLEGISAGSQPWVGVEELGEAGLVVFVEVLGSL